MARKARKVSFIRRMLTARGRSLEITKAGNLFILMTLAVGFAAVNSGSNLLHVIFGAQMAMIIGSGILSEASVRRIRATRQPVSTLHADTRGALRVEVQNGDIRHDVLSVSVEDDDRVAGAGESVPVFAVRVPAGGSVTLHSTITMPRRGRWPIPQAVVSTRFPFGLFVKRRDLPVGPDIIVYPRIHDVVDVLAGALTSDEGETSGRVARVGEFFGLREYLPGDDLRRIHWPATARLQTPIVREHEAHRDQELVLRLEPGHRGDPAFEREVENLASVAVSVLRDGRARVALEYDGAFVVPAGAGPDQEHRVLGFLALVGLEAAA